MSAPCGSLASTGSEARAVWALGATMALQSGGRVIAGWVACLALCLPWGIAATRLPIPHESEGCALFGHAAMDEKNRADIPRELRRYVVGDGRRRLLRKRRERG